MSADRPRREVAYRLFAAEFEDADLSYAESDEERAPNYVVTPTGARVNRVFVVGVLTEVEQVSDDVVRARIVDPTGAFVVYAGQYQPEALAFFERADPPTFVAVTGKARTFQPEDADRIYTSIRPETVNEVTAETRDRWVVQTAEHTLDRIETFAGALDLSQRGTALERELRTRGLPPGIAAGIPRAIDHYGTTAGYLNAVRTMAIQAAEVVANERDEVSSLDVAPDENPDEPLEMSGSLPETAYADAPTVAEEMPESEASEVSAESEPSESAAESADDEPAAEQATAESAAESADDEPAAEQATEESAAESADGDSVVGSPEDGQQEGDVEAVETDEMYELSEEERAAVEEEYDVGFETGNEVQEPGEADIDAPEPDPEAEGDEPGDGPADAVADEPTEPAEESAEGEATSDRGGESEAGEDVDDVDLEDVVVETMSELDDGDGAPRDELVATVVDDYGVDEAAVEDAIQDALMGGRCYESGEDRITPI